MASVGPVEVRLVAHELAGDGGWRHGDKVRHHDGRILKYCVVAGFTGWDDGHASYPLEDYDTIDAPWIAERLPRADAREAEQLAAETQAFGAGDAKRSAAYRAELVQVRAELLTIQTAARRARDACVLHRDALAAGAILEEILDEEAP